jgi:hypothetical protein
MRADKDARTLIEDQQRQVLMMVALFGCAFLSVSIWAWDSAFGFDVQIANSLTNASSLEGVAAILDDLAGRWGVGVWPRPAVSQAAAGRQVGPMSRVVVTTRPRCDSWRRSAAGT